MVGNTPKDHPTTQKICKPMMPVLVSRPYSRYRSVLMSCIQYCLPKALTALLTQAPTLSKVCRVEQSRIKISGLAMFREEK